MTQQGPNPIEVYEAAAQAMQSIVAGVRADQLNAPTPCTEWSVQALINHNINVSQFFNSLLTGGAAVAMEVSGPLPSEGAAAAFEADSGLAEVCFGVLQQAAEDLRQGKAIGPEVTVPISGSIQDKLLGLSAKRGFYDFAQVRGRLQKVQTP